jgi:hypothetical protein
MVTVLTDLGEHRFGAEIDAEWTIGGKPNGGYLLALLGRAATASGPHPHVLAASAHYLRAPEPGPVQIEVEVLRAGRGASQVRAGMNQDRRRCVEALLTTGELVQTEPTWSSVPLVDVADFGSCVRIPSQTPLGLPVAIMDQVDLRMDPAVLGFAAGKPSGRGELRGWLHLLDGEPFDANALLFAVDALPPATFEVAQSGWVPTLELTAYIRALPAPGPLRILQRALLIDSGRVDESCFVWDSTGRLVAQATQLAGIRLK